MLAAAKPGVFDWVVPVLPLGLKLRVSWLEGVAQNQLYHCIWDQG